MTILLREKIEVMQAAERGERIECKSGNEWREVPTPRWNWSETIYRVAAPTPDSIDWSHVDPQWKFMARDKKEDLYLFRNEPEIIPWYDIHDGGVLITDLFTSYRRGTVAWNKSLVRRPE